jgi:hypothetical protein
MRLFAAAILFTLCNLIPVARAALGMGVDSVQADARTLKGTLTATDMSGYSVHQIKRPDGAILREFISPAGQVFGIAWQGPMMPNLSQLLGPSYVLFQQATPSTHHRGPISVHVSSLVVQTGGHMRDFHVRAYLENLLPNGVSQEVVK